jgi:hypothetical protein
MLMQLVCVDRRYQRMNCFNIRELQGILKRRFFTDLVNSADHREILSSSMIGLRFKTNNTANLDHDVLSFFKLGTNNVSKSRSISFENNYGASNALSSSINPKTIFPQSTGFYSVLNILSLLTNLISVKPLTSMITIFSFSTYSNFFVSVKSNLSFYTLFNLNTTNLQTVSNNDTSMMFSAKDTNFSESNVSSFSETSTAVRFSRFSNPTISYDYKCGNYIGI